MNNKTNKVFFGWLNLTDGERQELEAAIRRFNSATEPERRQLRESVTKVITGPLGSGSGSGCPCCGR
jgi:hypothetical protein